MRPSSNRRGSITVVIGERRPSFTRRHPSYCYSFAYRRRSPASPFQIAGPAHPFNLVAVAIDLTFKSSTPSTVTIAFASASCTTTVGSMSCQFGTLDSAGTSACPETIAINFHCLRRNWYSYYLRRDQVRRPWPVTRPWKLKRTPDCSCRHRSRMGCLRPSAKSFGQQLIQVSPFLHLRRRSQVRFAGCFVAIVVGCLRWMARSTGPSSHRFLGERPIWVSFIA